MLKIRTKLILNSIIPYFLLIIILIFFYLYDTTSSIEKMYSARLALYNREITNTVIDSINSNGLKGLSGINGERDYGRDKIFIQVFDKNFSPLMQAPSFFSDSRIMSGLKDKPQHIRVEQNDIHYHCEPQILETKKGSYILITAIEAGEFETEEREYRIRFFKALPFIIAILIFHSFYSSRIAFTPVKNMIKEMKEITATNLHRRIKIPEPEDEIRELGVSLNDMINRLEESFENQKLFVSNASHEIRTPLTIIRSQLELLQEKTGAAGEKEIPEIILEVDSLSRLTRSLLTLTRIDAGGNSLEIEDVRLDELLIESVRSLEKYAQQKKVKLDIKIDEAIEIKGDSEKIKCVFGNLIDNGIKYSPENSRVKILLKRKDGLFAVFSVTDEGTGISEKDKSHIFNRFYRSDETRANAPGSGLGLAIVSEIVKLHKGKIEFESEVDKGSVFTVILPLSL